MDRPTDTHAALVAWLGARAESAPPSLRQPLVDAVMATGAAGAGTLGDLSATAGEQLLARLLAEGCGDRTAASQLLAADALVTYAFEAAAEDASQASRAIDARAAEAMRSVAMLGEGR